MQNEKIILTVAEAVLANTKVLQTLVDSLPKETQVAVAEKVVKTTPVAAPVQEVAAQVVAPVVAPAPVAAPVVSAPVVAPAPTFNAPALGNVVPVPFNDQKGMVGYVMDTYKALGPRGAGIQNVLTGMGITNINEVKPEQYITLFAGIEALKAG